MELNYLILYFCGLFDASIRKEWLIRMEKRIVIFASGNGSNAENIITYFKGNGKAKVVLVLSNRKDAKVLERAKKLEVPAGYFSRQELEDPNGVKEILKKTNPDLIVLAGFLWKFPETIVTEYPNKIINIHPALLPKYGGKGMYGNFVHQAVIENKEMESGISIHYVNEEYDEGTIILQKKVLVTMEDTPESLAQKIHKLEYEWFPKVIETLLFDPEDISENLQ